MDPGYFGRGIGTELCRESVRWAREHGYVAVAAPGAPAGLVEFARWYGHMPWTTYAKLGFEPIHVPPEESEETPGWLRGEVHSPIREEIGEALSLGRPTRELLERFVLLRIRQTAVEPET